MRNTLKITLVFVIIIAALLLIPNISNAATYEAKDAASLTDAINQAKELRGVQLITLTDNIIVEGPNPINVGGTAGSTSIKADIVIDGQGKYSITGSENWTSLSGDQSMFTANPQVKLTLKDVTLKNGPKYAAQAYNGGSIVLDNVRIEDFDYGAILNNGGNVTIKSLSLGLNGDSSKGYNGIEMSKGEYTTEEPVLVMDGTISAEQTENVVRLATNDNLTTYKVENGENAVNKIAVSENKVVITDEDNNVIYMSNEPIKDDGSKITGTEEGSNTEKYIVTIDFSCGPKHDSYELLVEEGTILKSEDIKALLNIGTGYRFAGFFSDEKYTAEYDFSKAITANTEIFAKAVIDEDTTTPEDPSDTEEPTNPSEEEPTTPSEEEPVDGEKDETPKTGVSTYIGVAAFVVVASVATMVVLKKEKFIV